MVTVILVFFSMKKHLSGVWPVLSDNPNVIIPYSAGKSQENIRINDQQKCGFELERTVRLSETWLYHPMKLQTNIQC